jgi:pimeloyl-ACP methyl ester carboxylesterase
LRFENLDPPTVSPTNGDVFELGEGEPVVLLHSSMSNKYQWRTLVERLSARYCCIAIDLLGYGGAHFPENAITFSLADEAAHVRARLSAILGRDQKLHLVGHSYGGAVALHLAQFAQHRLRSLTLFEPVSFHLLPEKHIARSVIRVVAERVRREVNTIPSGCYEVGTTERRQWLAAAQLFIDFWGGEGSFTRLDESKQLSITKLLPKVVLDFQALLADDRKLDSLSNLAVPTCLIGGRLSPMCTRQLMYAMSETLPQVTTHWVPAGHMAPLTDAIRVNPVIESFINAHAPSHAMRAPLVVQ